MKRILFLLLAVVMSLTQVLAQQDSITVGTGTSANQSGPIPGFFANHRSVQLFTSAEMNMPMGGIIEGISLEVGTVTVGTSSRQYRIYMKEVSDETLPASMVISTLSQDATLVYASTSGEPVTANSWHNITLQTPFVYSGAGSLYIYYEGEGCTSNGGCAVTLKGTTGASRAYNKCWDTTVPDFNTPIARSNDNRANHRFFFSPIGDDYCYPAQSLTISNVELDGVELSWTSDNNNFIVQYKGVNDSWDSENVVTMTTSSTSFAISGLNHSSLYTARVASVCESDTSVWASISFNTLCDVISEFPWTETFDQAWTYQYAEDTVFRSAPLCWINMTTKAQNSTYITKQNAGAAYMYGYGSSSSTVEAYRNSEWLMTPILELTGGEVLNFFTMKSASTYSPELRIYAYEIAEGDITSLDDTVNFVLIDSITSFTTSYQEKEISLSELSGQFRLAFVRNRTIGHGAVYVNDVTVRPTPACARPSGLTASNITGSSVDLSWTDAEGAASYNVYYKASTDTDWTVVPATETTFTLTGLEQRTTYTIDVTTVCEDGTETGFTFEPSLSVRTTCATLVPPVLETFDTYPAGTAATNCWKEAKGAWVDMANPDSTLTVASNNWGSYSNYVFDSHAAIELYSNTRKDWLVSPQIDLGDGSIVYDLKFDLAFTYWSSGAPAYTVGNQRFAVVVSTDGGQTWDMDNAMIWDSTSATEPGHFINEISNAGQRIVFDLSEYTGNIVVGFYGEQLTSGGDNRIHIDNFQVVEHVDCLDLVSCEVSAISPTSVTITWDTTDIGEDYIVAYSEGDSLDFATATMVTVPNGSELPYVISDLTAGTTYAFSVAYACGGQYANPEVVILPSAPEELPFFCDFEQEGDADRWTILNSTHTSKWYIGQETAVPGNTKLYVSSDNGNTLSYNKSGIHVSYAYTTIQFPEDGLAYKLRFKYRGGGESNYDFVKVGLWPLSEDLDPTVTSLPSWVGSTTTQEGFTYSPSTKFNLADTATWAEINIPSTDISGTLKNLVFAWRQDSGGGNDIGVEIDSISLEALTCVPPTSFVLAEEGAQANSLTFDMTTVSGDEWEIQYKPYGADLWTSLITTSTTGIVIDELLSGTMYQIRCRSICDGDSSWFTQDADGGYVLYQTLCEDIFVTEDEPFVETFDAPTWFRNGNITTDNDYAPECWFNIDGKHASYNWRHVTTASYNYNSSAGSLAMYSYSTATSDTLSDWFVTPIFDLQGTETLSFYAKTGSSQETLKIMYYNVDELEDMTSRADTANFVELHTIVMPANQDYTAYDIALTELTGRYRLAFYASVPGNYLRIDEVSVHISSCNRPSSESIYVSNVTPTSAVVNIDDELNSAWVIYYKPANETSYTEVSTTSTSTELTDLVPNTQYEFYVVGSCDGALSEASVVFDFATPCSYITELPFTEGFEGAWAQTGLSNIASPDCWINFNGGYSSTSYTWKTYTTATGVYDGLACAQSYGYTSSTTTSYVNNDFLITPAIDVEGGARVRFYAKKGSTSYNGKIRLKYYDLTETGDITSVSDTANFVDIIEISDFTTTYAEYTFDLPQLPSTYRLALARQDTANGYIYIDNFSISPVPTCIRPVPTSVAASNITTNSATITWTDEDETHSAWNVYYRVAGTEDFLVVPATEASVELTGLNSAENYEVFVRTNCGSEESEDTYSYTFTTLQEPESIPFTTDFEAEGTNGWLLKNGDCGNKWYVGTPSGATSASLFISNDNGVTAGYTVASTYSVVIAEKLFQLGESDSVRISFDLTIGGESSYDYLKVYWLPVDSVYTASSASVAVYYGVANYAQNVIMKHPNDATKNYINLLTGTQNLSVTIPNSPNEQRKLVFVWKNDGSSGTAPGAIIDNFNIEEVYGDVVTPDPCDAPTALVANNITETTADITWTGTATSYEVRLNAGAAETVTGTTKQYTGLTANTAYTVEVRAVCEGQTSDWASVQFTTLAEQGEDIVAPTVATLAATNITHESATLNGTITAGNETITAQGFMYKATAAANWTTVAETSQQQ